MMATNFSKECLRPGMRFGDGCFRVVSSWSSTSSRGRVGGGVPGGGRPNVALRSAPMADTELARVIKRLTAA